MTTDIIRRPADDEVGDLVPVERARKDEKEILHSRKTRSEGRGATQRRGVRWQGKERDKRVIGERRGNTYLCVILKWNRVWQHQVYHSVSVIFDDILRVGKQQV